MAAHKGYIRCPVCDEPRTVAYSVTVTPARLGDEGQRDDDLELIIEQHCDCAWDDFERRQMKVAALRDSEPLPPPDREHDDES